MLGTPAWISAGLAGCAAGAALGWSRAAIANNDAAVSVTEAEHDGQSIFFMLNSVVGLLELPTVVLDEKLHVTSFNAAAEDLFAGLTLSQPLARLSRHPDLHGAVELVLGDGLARVVDVADHSPKGRRLRASVSLLPVSKAQLSRFLLIQFRDLSEQDRLAQMRSDFIANASHELRTPLASLKGFIETLQGSASHDASAREKFLGIMSAQSARMTRILDDLLSLSRIEMRVHVPPTQTVQLKAIIREVAQGLDPLAKDAGIKLVLHGDDPEQTNVRGDRDELVQVFQNLIQNAIKYGRSGGHVDVSLKRVGEDGRRPRVQVVIADDGPGIAEEHLPRLTERFYRVDTATSREKGGTGLGLAIVKHILNRHRGELKIASELGKGSTFTVSLEAVI